MERDEDRFEQGLESVASWARSEVEHDLRAKSRAVSSLGKQVSKLQSELKSERERREQAAKDFQRARGERDSLFARVESMAATIEAQKQALNAAEKFKQEATAGRVAMERKIRDLGDANDFWKDKDARMTVDACKMHT